VRATPGTAAAGLDRAAVRRVGSFLGLFAVWTVGGHVLLGVPGVERLVVDRWVDGNVALARQLAQAAGLQAASQGKELTAHGATLTVNQGCDGTTALLIVAAAMLAFPASWAARALGVVAGALGVFAVNAVRLASLLWVTVHWPDRLDLFHVDIWQPAMVLVSFGLFGVWSALAGTGRARPPSPMSPRP
jgi:exosortase/archaeosortase family protein